VGPDLTSTVTDADPLDIITFRIVDGNSLARFALQDPSKLQLVVAKPPSTASKPHQPLDFEDVSLPNPFVLVIEATDISGLTATAALLVLVANVQEPPTLVESANIVLPIAERRFIHGVASQITLPVQAIFADDDSADKADSDPSLHRLAYTLSWFSPLDGAYRSLPELSDEMFNGTLVVASAFSTLAPIGGLTLTGTASYGPVLQLQTATPESPVAQSLQLLLVAKDAAGNAAQTIVTLRVEVAGCTVAAAAWNALSNPNGNFNEQASLSKPMCIYPELALTEDATASATVRIASPTGDPEADGAVELRVQGSTTALGPDGKTRLTSVSVKGADAALASGSLPELPATALSVVRDAAVILGPAGATFDPPVTLRMYVGSLPDNSAAAILVAKELGQAGTSIASTPAYGGFEPADGCQFTSVPGGGFVECTTGHFSLAVPAVIGFPPAQAPQYRVLAAGGGCPRQCSGQGECLSTGICQCFEGWTGGDCNLRACASGPSWAQGGVIEPQVQWSECSGRGLCNRRTGLCQCIAPHTGAACQRLQCPNRCSGNGQCLTIDSMDHTAGYGSAPGEYGSSALAFMAQLDSRDAIRPVFEAPRLTGCVCDAGFTGPDCGERLCELGDDPITHCQPGAVDCAGDTDGIVFELTLGFVTAGGTVPTDWDELSLDVSDVLLGEFRTRPVTGVWNGGAAASAEALRRAFVALPASTVPAVSVTRSVSTATRRSWLITMTAPENSGGRTTVACPAIRSCGEPGCSPLFRQMLVIDTTGTTGTPGHIVLDDATQFVPASPAATSSEFDTHVVLTVTAGTAYTTFTSTSRSPSSSATVVPGPSGTIAGELDPNDGTDMPPIPLVAELGSGLIARFTTLSPTPGDYHFRVSAPSCALKIHRHPNAAYEAIECSNRGICDRYSGSCDCFPGFEGESCSRQTALA
jgi:hypothetical protein